MDVSSETLMSTNIRTTIQCLFLDRTDQAGLAISAQKQIGCNSLKGFIRFEQLTRLLNLNLPQAPELTTSWPENSPILALQPTMWGWSVGSASKLEKVATG